MSVNQKTMDVLDQAIAAIPSCALDESGVHEQRARYAHLAPSVTDLKREAEAVSVEFRESFDCRMLDQALEVERACCPFFQFELDEARRRLRITVREPDQLQALDAVAYAFGVGHRVSHD